MTCELFKNCMHVFADIREIHLFISVTDIKLCLFHFPFKTIKIDMEQLFTSYIISNIYLKNEFNIYFSIRYKMVSDNLHSINREAVYKKAY